MACFLVWPLSVLAGQHTLGLGDLPDPAHLPTLLTFNPTKGSSSALNILADVVLTSTDKGDGRPQEAISKQTGSLHAAGPYSPAATLPPKVVKKILVLEFVEMAELRADIWSAPSESAATPRRPGKPPVTNIQLWLECYGCMAAVLTARFSQKAPELWAYQTTILHAAHAYKGANWVAYDRLFRREMCAKKDLNWSVPNLRLYSQVSWGGQSAASSARTALPRTMQRQPVHTTPTPHSWGGSRAHHLSSSPAYPNISHSLQQPYLS